jgi:hypothetical protein
MGFIVELREVKYGSDICSLTAGGTKNVREQLKSRDFYVETVIKASKTYLNNWTCYVYITIF